MPVSLVIGATGSLGSDICGRLTSRGDSVRALVRPTADPVQVEGLTRLGVEPVRGNLRDRDSLERACAGVDQVFSTASAIQAYGPGNDLRAVDEQGQIDLIDAANTCGVRLVVYTSFSKNIENIFPLSHAKRTVEQHLLDSGLDYVILRPSFFMESWLSPGLGFDAKNTRARVYGKGENPISWVSLHDVAESAVLSAEQPKARNTILELGGPEALSPHRAIHTFEEVLGRKFEVEHVPEEALEAQLRSSADPLQQTFAGLMLAYARGDRVDPNAARDLFHLSLTSVHDFAARMERA